MIRLGSALGDVAQFPCAARLGGASIAAINGTPSKLLCVRNLGV
jgi:hypothetical protein